MDIPTTDIPDLVLDDVIHIDTDSAGGIIAGSNPRSVLLAVYCYLKKNGCRWLFPDIDGEYIPIKEIEPVSYHHYMSHAFGSDWKKLTSLLDKLYDERVFKMISDPKIDKHTGLRDYRGSFVSDVMDKWLKVCDEIDLLRNSQSRFEKRPQSVL